MNLILNLKSIYIKLLLLKTKILLFLLKKKIIFILLALFGTGMTFTCVYYYMLYPKIVTMSTIFVTAYVQEKFSQASKEAAEAAIQYLTLMRDLIRPFKVRPDLILQRFCPPHVFREWMLENAPKNIFRDDMGRLYYAVPKKILAAFNRVHHLGDLWTIIDPKGYGAYQTTIPKVKMLIQEHNQLIQAAKEIVKIEDQQISKVQFYLLIGAIVGVTITVISLTQLV